MLTRSGLAASRERANILSATLNTEVSGPNGNVSTDPGKLRQRSCSSAAPITTVAGLPDPMTTQISGDPAGTTGRPVSAAKQARKARTDQVGSGGPQGCVGGGVRRRGGRLIG